MDLKSRTEILEYSLHMEDMINSLLFAYLDIFEKKETNYTKNKLNITFKSKIDLLFDIDVLSKEEHSDLELLMNFRNKFLHNINCNSFLDVLGQLDNGIKNRFKKHLDKSSQIENEESCRKACFNLFIENIKTIKKKFEKKRNHTEEKAKFITALLTKNVKMIDLYFDLIKRILIEVESAELENQKVLILAEKIGSICETHSNNIKTDKEMVVLDKEIQELFANEKIKRLLM